ncbi:MAG: Pyridoxamine 5-phosphate oxidase [Devosia sp.]|nr:Pyridoxamine 5-phosphate oxidase [Devosia sp.]
MPALSDLIFDDAFTGAIDPFALFEEWFAVAKEKELNDPHAMALATVNALGLPNVRMVLLNARDQRGFAFFTNFDSAKGEELQAHPQAALVMHWKSVRRQVRMRGPVEVVTVAEADAYFATRSRGSQIGAHASAQSRPLASRDELKARWDRLDAEFGSGPIPRPVHWSGFRLVPSEFEFWQDGEFRLHNRMQFLRADAQSPWTRQRLNP